MANNDYWAYLREQRELRNDELMHYRVGGERSGYTKYPDKYKPVGDKAKGFFDRAGNYISTVATNISNKVNKGIHDARTIIRNNIAEGKRTSYGDMASNRKEYKFDNDKYYDQRINNPNNKTGTAPKGMEYFKQLRGVNVDQLIKMDKFKNDIDSYISTDLMGRRGAQTKEFRSQWDENTVERIAANVANNYALPWTDDVIDKIKPIVEERLKKHKIYQNVMRDERNSADPLYKDQNLARPQDAMKEKQEKSRKQVADTAKKLSALTMGHEDGWDSPSNPRAMFGATDLRQLAILADMGKKYRDGKSIDTLHPERYKQMVEFVKTVQSSPAVRREFAKLYDSPLSKGYGEDMIRIAMQINLDKL